MNDQLHLLVVEDNPADADFIHELLPTDGPVNFHIESVARLSLAFARLERKGIDLVLLDLGLPDSQGLQTFHQLRQAVPRVPIIVLSGGDDQEMAVAAVREGAQDYLVKGRVSGNLLFRAIRYALERKRTEVVLEARVRLSEFARTHTLDELLTQTLDEAELLTSSAIGFCHFVEPDQITLSLQTWSTNTIQKMCNAEGKGRHYPADQAGVWADALRQRRPVIHNDYPSLTHRKGLPPGHSPVERILVVPILRQEQVVALLGVGNKPGEYGAGDVASISALASLAWDIVLTKRTEAALRAGEERRRSILRTAMDGFWRVDLQARLLEVNDTYCQMSGYDMAELLTLRISDLEAAETVTDTVGRLQKIMARGADRFESRHRRKDGTEYPVEVSVQYRPEEGGYCVGFIRDITERKRVESERERLIGELKEALAHVKTLTGLVPICANCKKIRDDKNYWHAVEIYIEKHSNATFTHGMCPACIKIFFPGMDEE